MKTITVREYLARPEVNQVSASKALGRSQQWVSKIMLNGDADRTHIEMSGGQPVAIYVRRVIKKG